MDLTTSYPRSVREKLFGVVQIARTIDKGKAAAAGTLGEYDFNCPMDQHVFEFLGTDADQLTAAIKSAKGDADIEAFVKPLVEKKTPAEIEHFNADWLAHEPEKGTGAYNYFISMRDSLDPSRTDIVAWADLLDLDEKRPVPQRATA